MKTVGFLAILHFAFSAAGAGLIVLSTYLFHSASIDPGDTPDGSFGIAIVTPMAAVVLLFGIALIARASRFASTNGQFQDASRVLKTVRVMMGIPLAAGYVAVAYVILYLTADPPAYCNEQQRYLSDGEFINTIIPLVRADIKREQPIDKSSGSFYADWDGYVPAPGDITCCEVDRSGSYSLQNQIFRTQSIETRIGPPGRTGYKPSVSFYFDVCGVLLHSDVGIRYAKVKKQRDQ